MSLQLQIILFIYFFQAWDKGLAVTVARYLTQYEMYCPEPSIRIALNAMLTADEIAEAVATIKSAFESTL